MTCTDCTDCTDCMYRLYRLYVQAVQTLCIDCTDYMYRLLKEKQMTKKAKQIIHRTIQRHILLIVNECWIFIKRHDSRNTAGDMITVRMIESFTKWDRQRNKNLYRESNITPNIDVIIKVTKLRWYGQAMRRRFILKVALSTKKARKRSGKSPRFTIPAALANEHQPQIGFKNVLRR